MASGYIPLPAPQIRNAMADFSGINQGIDSLAEKQQQNAMMAYRKDRDKVSDARSNAMMGIQQNQESRAQATFDDKRGEEALNQLAGIYQTIEQAPEAERAALYGRVQPLYSRLRTRIADFDTDLQAMGVDPNDHVAVGKLVMGRARGYVDPTKSQAPSNVQEWQYFSQLPPDKKQEYLTMKRSEKYLDTGTEFTRPNPIAPGENVSTVPKNIAGKAAQEAVGDAQGKASADIPRVAANAERALQTIEAIRTHPGKKYGLGLSAPSGYIPGTEARGFKNLVDQAAGQTFLEAFNSLRGGGQITEAEGAKATQALARLDRYQSPEDFDAALKDLEDVVRKGLEVSRQKAGASAPAPATGGGLAPGEYVFDPATGTLRPK